MNNSNILKGSSLYLRALEPEDLEILYQWENDTDIWEISETVAPISKYILKNYLKNSGKDIYQTKQMRMMICQNETDKELGLIDVYNFEPYHRRAAIGILIGATEERGKGYALDALTILKNYCFKVLGLHQVYCNISSENTASIELFKKAGFEHTSTRKDWLWKGHQFQDAFLLQLIS